MKNPFSKEIILKVREKLEEIEELLNRSGIVLISVGLNEEETPGISMETQLWDEDLLEILLQALVMIGEVEVELVPNQRLN